MQFAFALPESISVTYGAHGVWLSKDDAFPADDPFVLAHLDMFSLTPSTARSTDGRTFVQVPMSERAVGGPVAAGQVYIVGEDARPARGRGRTNG